MKINELVGKTIINITGMEKNSDEIKFQTSDDKSYKMYHQSDCCESVYLEDIVGVGNDLFNNPILSATEESNRDKISGLENVEQDDEYGSFTWTFYRLSTIKGTVVLRWYGESNGYYSEEVYFEEVEK